MEVEVWEETEVSALLKQGILEIGDGFRAKNSELAEAGVPFARAGNINGGFHFEDADRVPTSTFERVGRKHSLAGDALFTSKGTVGRFAFVKPETEPFVYSPQLCFWRVLNHAVIEPRFVYYWLQGTESRRQLDAFKGQTDMADYVSLKDQRSMSMTLPKIDEQRRIAWVLGSLDDKIELNKRMAQTLEDLAAAIFRARFIDFDGVEEFEESEVGPIPKGWRVGELGEIVTNTNDRASAGQSEVDAPYIGLDAMPRGSTVLWSWDARSKVTGETRKFGPGDILFGKLRPYFKKVAMAPVSGSCSTEILVLRTENDYSSVALGHLTDDRFIEYCVAHSRGTKMPRSEWKDMKAYPIPIPPAEVAEKLGSPMQAIGQQAVGLIHETRTLCSLRDELLPRLISGQIRVPEGVGLDSDVTEVAEELIEA